MTLWELREREEAFWLEMSMRWVRVQLEIAELYYKVVKAEADSVILVLRSQPDSKALDRWADDGGRSP